MSLLKDIADALAAGLAAHTWLAVDHQPSVARVNWPSVDLEQMANPVIAVVPAGDELVRVNRVSFQHDYTVNVFIGRQVSTDTAADAMLGMAEEAVDLIVAHSWGAVAFPTTSPMSVEIQINPDDALQDRNVWRAVIAVTYRTFR